MVGDIIQHYKILKKLGSCGKGVVCLAEGLKIDRIAELKFLPVSVQN
ncbi:hypothetical protein ACFL6I_09840 [candidate division KSB1 bacterium]